MLVLTGLLPNSTGNQSMLNSLKGYNSEYEILILTVADSSSKNYLKLSEILEHIPGVRVVYLWPKIIAEFGVEIRKKQSRESRIVTSNDQFVNSGTGFLTRFAFLVRSIILAFAGLIATVLIKPRVICVYEINGMMAAAAIRALFSKVKIFGKFQGTILGVNISKNDFFSVSKIEHPLDLTALRYAKSLDCAIMTNDGTSGLDVLKKFGLKEGNILFIPNGVDERFFRSDRTISERECDNSDELKTISVSRLIGWKRVDKIVEGIGLYCVSSHRKICHTIIGGGSSDEIKLINSLIGEKLLASNVYFRGELEIDDIICALRQSDLLISVYSHTNVTNPIFEALALGVPVLTIRENALLEVLGDRAEGCFFIEESRSEYLASALAEALNKIDRESIEQKKSYLKQINHPTWDKRSEVELDFIKHQLFQ